MAPSPRAARARDAESRRIRAERILDVGMDLLMRWGYRRTTIDDVAREAGIGKGTVYLHWRTREELFEAVVQREALRLLDRLADAMRADPGVAILHRLTEVAFGMLSETPLIRALFLGDAETLGDLNRNANALLESQQDEAFKELLRLQSAYGMVRSDFSVDDLFFSYQAICLGFLTSDSLLSEQNRMPPGRLIELLVTTVRLTFEPERQPSAQTLLEIAPRAVELIDRMAEVTRGHLRRAYE